MDIADRSAKAPQGFLPNRRFRKTYGQLFKIDPITANIFLLLAELAGSEGDIILPKDPEARHRELAMLIESRFEDPAGRQL